MRGPWLAVVLAVSTAFPGAERARAGDPAPPTPAQTLVAELEAAKTAKDDLMWVETLKRVPEVYAGATDADKKVLAQTTGHGLKAKTEQVQKAALEALVGTKDGEVAWKAGLKSEMPDAKAETAKPFSVKVVEALKDLHPEAAVATLLSLFHDAKDPVVSARAAAALGGYERSKQRLKILEELIKGIRAAMPGASRDGKAAAPTPRWTEMGPAAGNALNELTGQTFGDVDDWLKFYDENKKKPAGMFKNEL
jgi:hypothetical protein